MLIFYLENIYYLTTVQNLIKRENTIVLKRYEIVLNPFIIRVGFIKKLTKSKEKKKVLKKKRKKVIENKKPRYLSRGYRVGCV